MLPHAVGTKGYLFNTLFLWCDEYPDYWAGETPTVKFSPKRKIWITTSSTFYV